MFWSFPTEEAAREHAERKGYIVIAYKPTETGGQLTILDRMMNRSCLPVVHEQAEIPTREGEPGSAGDAGTEDGQRMANETL